MSAGYWVLICFGVICMLAGPIGYRVLYRQKSSLTKKRWNLYTALCGLLFLMGVILLIVLGLQYPLEPPPYSDRFDPRGHRQLFFYRR